MPCLNCYNHFEVPPCSCDDISLLKAKDGSILKEIKFQDLRNFSLMQNTCVCKNCLVNSKCYTSDGCPEFHAMWQKMSGEKGVIRDVDFILYRLSNFPKIKLRRI